MTDKELERANWAKNGRKLTAKEQIHRLAVYCYDRYDRAAEKAWLAELDNREHDRRLESVRVQRWDKRAHRYSQLEEWI